MNNEEKILSMLEGLTTTVSTLVTKVDNLEHGQAKLEADIGELKQGQAELKQEVNHLSIMTEDIQHNVEILAEGHTAVIEKLNGLPDFDETKTDVEVLKKAVAKHSDKFSNLKEAL